LGLPACVLDFLETFLVFEALGTHIMERDFNLRVLTPSVGQDCVPRCLVTGELIQLQSLDIQEAHIQE
jgi:hypothetical protein